MRATDGLGDRPTLLLLALGVLVAGAAAAFYVSVLQMKRLDPGHTVPRRQRVRTWMKAMSDFFVSMP